MKLKYEVMEKLYDGNIRIENIFYMQLVTACDSLPDSFWEVFNDDRKDALSAIGLSHKDTSEYRDLKYGSELLDFLHDNKITGVLIQFATPVPRNFSFDTDGEFSHCSSGWGLTSWHFAYGETIDEVLAQAIKVQDQYFNECQERARGETKQ